MRVILKNIKNCFDNNEIDVVKNFVSYLQSELKLKQQINIRFVKKREGSMTTGVRKKDEICILTTNRLLIDILRTLSHEWVHEYQFQRMEIGNKGKIQDIGGPEENMANVLSGIYIKKFQNKYPEIDPIIYNE